LEIVELNVAEHAEHSHLFDVQIPILHRFPHGRVESKAALETKKRRREVEVGPDSAGFFQIQHISGFSHEGFHSFEDSIKKFFTPDVDVS
jgi:hypothetical protein